MKPLHAPANANSINGHDLPKDGRWHREERFTAGDLPPPYRPLMEHETYFADDEVWQGSWGWQRVGHKGRLLGFNPEMRTTRPIPNGAR